MKVKRVAGALGAELHGVDLGSGIDAAQAGELRSLLNEHEVLFLRDQKIEPAQQKALAAIFGGWLSPFDPNRQNLVLRLADPMTAGPDGGTFWLGSDALGRDVLWLH